MTITISNSENKKMLIPIKRTIQQYQMIEDGDKIAVGISGGKDSSALLYLLTAFQRKSPIQFTIVPISLSLGFEGMDVSPLEAFVEQLGYKLHLQPTNIGEVVFDIRKEKNPCSLCANMRRGTLYDVAKSYGCNKVALGHHLDDAIETFFMNLFFGGKMGSFQPKLYLDRTDITLIRPLITIEEQDIIQFVAAKEIPIIENPCPANKKTKREEMKQLILQLNKQYPDLKHKFLTAMKNASLNDFWNADLYTQK